jgi:hypothetical protein
VIPRVGFAISALKRQETRGHGPESGQVNLYLTGAWFRLDKTPDTQI